MSGGLQPWRVGCVVDSLVAPNLDKAVYVSRGIAQAHQAVPLGPATMTVTGKARRVCEVRHMLGESSSMRSQSGHGVLIECILYPAGAGLPACWRTVQHDAVYLYCINCTLWCAGGTKDVCAPTHRLESCFAHKGCMCWRDKGCMAGPV
jgi:hypothetical protein